jgi:hypothetical protein
MRLGSFGGVLNLKCFIGEGSRTLRFLHISEDALEF